MSAEKIIIQTTSWIEKVVIALNFCPFASFPFNNKQITYKVDFSNDIQTHLEVLNYNLIELNNKPSIETSLIIYPNNFSDFETYLDFYDLANQFISDLEMEGIYQLASFHPDYLFADSNQEDPANFTNRSPYPMLHIIRELSVEKARESYDGVDEIPESNISLARKLGKPHFEKTLQDIKSNLIPD